MIRKDLKPYAYLGALIGFITAVAGLQHIGLSDLYQFLSIPYNIVMRNSLTLPIDIFLGNLLWDLGEPFATIMFIAYFVILYSLLGCLIGWLINKVK